MRQYLIGLLVAIIVAQSTAQASVYVLTHPEYMPGFFSVFECVLGALDWYEHNPNCAGLVIDFKNQGHYYEHAYGQNWWSYYFEPIHRYPADGDCKYFPINEKSRLTNVAHMQMSRERGYELITKYIRLKPHIAAKIETYVQSFFSNGPVIGVHYRGTDKRSEAHILPHEEVYQAIKKELAHYANARVFVATDDGAFLEYLRARLPKKILAIDGIRSNNGSPVHLGMPGSPYKKGEDALLDCILLSYCTKLVKTASNLSDTTLKFNPDLPVEFLTFDHDYNRTHKPKP